MRRKIEVREMEHDEKLRCLVVDGDDQKRAFLADALTYFQPGFDVTTASDAESAVRWLESTTPQIVVVGATLSPTEVTAVMAAHQEACADRERVVVFETRFDIRACVPVDTSVEVLELFEPLSLDAVLGIGRCAAEAARRGSTPAEVIALPGSLPANDLKMIG
jgi:DNA-binding NtrC family response regulator